MIRYRTPDAARRGRVAALTIIITVLAVAGCRSSSAEPVGRTDSDRYARALTAVCTAAADARASSPTTARKAFYDTAHQALHELATDAATTDRPVAARLLEAKETVESAFNATAEPAALAAEPAALAAELDTLAAAVADAITTASGTQPAPCPEQP